MFYNTVTTINDKCLRASQPYQDLARTWLGPGSVVMSDTKYKTMNITDTSSRPDLLSEMWCQNRSPIRWSRETFDSELTLGCPGTSGCRNMGVRAVRAALLAGSQGCWPPERVDHSDLENRSQGPSPFHACTHTHPPMHTLFLDQSASQSRTPHPSTHTDAHRRALLTACTPEWI